ncbi:Ig-like domain-containing protein [Pseudoclavibacter soli]|uniref:Ig-like domain-containing protein n=1 Tax=Pseudoclavibacter soli TaxID=452623 RepID=UPI000406675C|nr:Ig-like domain-containing protein [Pseudoclavibacter soli]
MSTQTAPRKGATIARGLALASVTATLVGATGAFGFTTAVADESPSISAQGLISEVTAAGDTAGASALEGAGTDSAGRTVAFVDTADASSAQLLDAIDNRNASGADIQVLQLDGEISAYSANDLVGGAGIGYKTSTGGYTCSTGFAAWSKTGAPAIITAGHCLSDAAKGASVYRTDPKQEAAAGDTSGYWNPIDAIGTASFVQYGGPGNTTGQNGAVDSLDIATVNITNQEVTPRALVTDWTTASSGDLSASATEVRSVASVDPSKTVTRSGRTSGVTTGKVLQNSDGTYLTDGWIQVSGHYVRGFATTAVSDHGDSGGSVVQGNAAVGVLSGGGETTDGVEISWVASLVDSIGYTGGYTVAVIVDAPELTSVADGGHVGTGATLSGTGQAGTTVTVSGSGVDTQTATVDSSGAWSVKAPATPGDYTLTLKAASGFSTSDSVTKKIAVDLGVPVVTTPAAVVGGLTEISGTGVPGATVTIMGDVTASTTVGSDGTWTAPAELGYGKHTLKLTQTQNGVTSAETSAEIAVAPAAPTISSPMSDAQYESGKPPTSVTGTGEPGATVTVSIDGHSSETTVGEDGTWSLPISTTLADGTHSISAVQTIEGVDSAAASVTVTVGNADAGETDGPSTDSTQQTSDGSSSSTTDTTAVTDGELAVTGASSGLLWAAVAAGAAALLGGAALIVRRILGRH